MATESILLDALRIPARYADEVLEAMESKKKVLKYLVRKVLNNSICGIF